MARVAFTAGRVAGFKCPLEKAQAFLWDSTALGLGLRATPSGKPAYVFQSRYQDKTIRITIGSPNDWLIDEARSKARELQRLIDQGRDPRSLKRDALAETVARTAATAAQVETDRRAAVKVSDAWPYYMKHGRPVRRDAWKPRYRADLVAMAAPGGERKKRGAGLTRPGPLAPLLTLRLSDVNEDSLKCWYDLEAKAGRHQATRALMMFRGFLRWCSGWPEYRAMVDREAGRAPAILESLPQVKKRTDCLEAAQLPGWFAGADKLDNKTTATYLKALLMTGARREEVAALKWADVDFQWSKLTLADKVDTTRTIPLTGYLAQQLDSLPRVNAFVFASTGKRGRITEPRGGHAKVLRDAGIEGLTIHGLRRSFSLLGEAAGAPAGAIAQVMGHKPSATAEGYRPRSIDALRPFLATIESHILGLAGIRFTPDVVSGRPRLVANGAAAL